MPVGVRVCGGVAADRPVRLEHVDDAPVAEAWHRDAGKLLERLAVVERGVEDGADLGDERRLLLRRLGRAAEIALADEQRRALPLDVLARGDVADEPGEERALTGGALDRRDRQLDRELASVGAQGGQLEPLVEQSRLLAVRDPSQRRPVGVAQRLGDHQRRHLLPDHVLAPVAEHLLRGGVELEHASLAVDRDHRVERRLEDRRLEGLALSDRLLGLLELDVLAELAAEATQEPEELGLGRPDLAGVELNGAQDPVLAVDGKRERREQAGRVGHVSAAIAGVAGDVLDPVGLGPLPRAAGKPLAARELLAAAQADEAAGLDARRLPDVDQAHRLLLLVDPPQRPELPAERAADRLERARGRVRQRSRLHQRDGERVLGDELVARHLEPEPQSRDVHGECRSDCQREQARHVLGLEEDVVPGAARDPEREGVDADGGRLARSAAHRGQQRAEDERPDQDRVRRGPCRSPRQRWSARRRQAPSVDPSRRVQTPRPCP